MKKLFCGLCAVLAISALTCVPVLAAGPRGDSFASGSTKKWETDVADPTIWEVNNGFLSINVSGTALRPKTGTISASTLRGKKLPVEKPDSNTWTASVKIDTDSFTASSGRARAEFRVDLVDSKGNPIPETPIIALARDSMGNVYWTCHNPAVDSGWLKPKTYVNKDGDRTDMEVKSGWQTMMIKSNAGKISYYIEGVRIGSCAVSSTDIYPAYLALGLQNYGAVYDVSFDNCYLYNGIRNIKEYTEEELEEREESLAEVYASKREKWTERNRKYYVEEDDRWYTIKQLEEMGIDPDGLRSKIDKDMPDSFWDY